MTRDEFNTTQFGPGMFAKHGNTIYPIHSVDFQEALLGLGEGNDEFWVRCESVEMVVVEQFSSSSLGLRGA